MVKRQWFLYRYDCSAHNFLDVFDTKEEALRHAAGLRGCGFLVIEGRIISKN